MIPVARTEKLLIQEVGNELVVYDQETNASHCLTPVAASVWHYCNGQNTIEDIARLLEKELNISPESEVDIRGLVYLSLEELERYRLLKQYLRKPVVVPTMSRRKIVKAATLVSGFAIGSMFPLVRSITAPEPAMAVSDQGSGQGSGNDPCSNCKCSSETFCSKGECYDAMGRSVGKCD